MPANRYCPSIETLSVVRSDWRFDAAGWAMMTPPFAELRAASRSFWKDCRRLDQLRNTLLRDVQAGTHECIGIDDFLHIEKLRTQGHVATRECTKTPPDVSEPSCRRLLGGL
jgi:hypothetical protein